MRKVLLIVIMLAAAAPAAAQRCVDLPTTRQMVECYDRQNRQQAAQPHQRQIAEAASFSSLAGAEETKTIIGILAAIGVLVSTMVLIAGKAGFMAMSGVALAFVGAGLGLLGGREIVGAILFCSGLLMIGIGAGLHGIARRLDQMAAPPR